jgi:hypothetical protein
VGNPAACACIVYNTCNQEVIGCLDTPNQHNKSVHPLCDNLIIVWHGTAPEAAGCDGTMAVSQQQMYLLSPGYRAGRASLAAMKCKKGRRTQTRVCQATRVTAACFSKHIDTAYA